MQEKDSCEIPAELYPSPLNRGDSGSQRPVDSNDLENSHAVLPAMAVEALQKWNDPPINMWRVFATFYSFFVFGMNDGAYGVSFAPLLSFFGIC